MSTRESRRVKCWELEEVRRRQETEMGNLTSTVVRLHSEGAARDAEKKGLDERLKEVLREMEACVQEKIELEKEVQKLNAELKELMVRPIPSV